MNFLAQQNSQWITRDALVKFSLLSFRKESLDISVRSTEASQHIQKTKIMASCPITS